jgi:hypothetical protein
MTTFFVDLWHDLREKRLWPVAVGLLAAIVAIPVVLFKPASAPSTPAAVVPPKSATETLPVVAVDAGPTEGSRLEAFNQKNPFKPMKDLAKQAPTANPSSSSSSSSGGSSSSSAGMSSGSSSSSGTSSSSGGSSSGGSTTTGGTTPSTTPSAPSVQWFHYTADFSFGAPGATKKFKSAASFTLLPDNQHPTIVFIGVADNHKSAVFFISDPAFTGAGEGKCNANGAACRFITLDLTDSGNEENFASADGSLSYDLKLLAIHKENLSTDSSGNPKPAPKSNGKTLEATGAGVSAATQTSEGVLPSLIAGGPGFARSQK